MIIRNEKERCSQCGPVDYTIEKVTYRNGAEHLVAHCLVCKKRIRSLPQEVTGSQQDFKMPFGKHKDKTLLEISLDDPDYLMWASQTLEKGIKRKIDAFLDWKPQCD